MFNEIVCSYNIFNGWFMTDQSGKGVTSLAAVQAPSAPDTARGGRTATKKPSLLGERAQSPAANQSSFFLYG